MSKARSREGPSRAALKGMPEVDFKTAKVRRNPHAEPIARPPRDGFPGGTFWSRPCRAHQEEGPDAGRRRAQVFLHEMPTTGSWW